MLPLAYVFTFTTGTAALPCVAAVSPADGSMDVPLETTVTVTFNLPMDHVSAEGSVSLSPSAAGGFLWPADNRISFVPDGVLTPETEYTVHVNENATVPLSPTNATVVIDGLIVNQSPFVITLSGPWTSDWYGDVGGDMTLNGSIPYQANVGDIEPGETVPFQYTVWGQTSAPFGFDERFNFTYAVFSFHIKAQ